MNRLQWESFCNFKNDFKKKVDEWTEKAPELSRLQKSAVEKAKAPLYPFETTVVYNKALDDVSESDDIKLIVIGDNPGKDEQLKKNNRYLVGQAGKIAEGYFRRNPELNIDFRKNVIILNKTPIHSGKTAQLKTIASIGGEKIRNLIQESQIRKAERTAQLHVELCLGAMAKSEDYNSVAPEIWLVGYSELKNKGIFSEYRNFLKKIYFSDSTLEIISSTFANEKFNISDLWEKVLVFQHFSMNRFSIDLGDFIKKNSLGQSEKTLEENIHILGKIHREEIFND